MSDDGHYRQLPTQAMVALRAGHKLEAIRIVHEQTGLGLAESKALVDRAADEQSPRMPQKAASREDAGALRLVAVVVVLGALAAAWLFI